MSQVDDNGLQIGPTLEDLDGMATEFVEVGREDITPEETQAEELIGGKFKSQDELLKAYEELQKKLGQGGSDEETTEETTDDATETNESEEANTDEPNGEDTPSSEGQLDVAKYSEEYAKDGALSEDSYKELAEKHNLPKDIVDSFMAGQVAIQQSRQAEIVKAAGSQEEYDAMLEWGTENLPDDEVDAFNNAIDEAVLHGKYTNLNVIVRGIKAQMAGNEPKYLKGKNENSIRSNVTPFKNRSEMVAAMSDPRYSSDPKYVREVESRLAVSDI